MMQRIRSKMQAEQGFTLIELLVVIVILGILAAVVVFAVRGLNDRGQGSACEIDRRTVETAQEAKYAQDRAYAANTTELANQGFLSSSSQWHATDSTGAVTVIAGTPCA